MSLTGSEERLGGGRDNGLHPPRRGGDAEAAGAVPGCAAGSRMLKTAEAAGRR